MAPHFARPLLSLQLPPATPPCLCAYHPCADLLAIRLHPQTLHIFLNGHLKDQYQFPSDISHISACSSYDELQKTAAFGVLTVDGIVWRITAPHSSSNSKRQMNDVQPGADQGNPRPKKARTTESQEDYHLESVEKPPVPPKDTIMAVSNPDVIHVTNEDHFVVQNVGLHIIPYTYMSVDGFLTSSTIGDLSFHSWVRYNRGIVLGRRARPSSRGAGDSDRVTCRMVATHSSSVEESSNTISCLTPNLFKALFGDKKPDILITGTKSGAVQFQSIAEGHGRDPELLTTLPEPIHAIYTARALLVPAPRYPLATAFLDPGAAGAAVDDGPKGHNTLLIVGLLGSLAIYASRPGDSAEPSEQCAAYREYHIATAVHASTMVGNMLLLSGQDGRVVAIPFDGDDFTAGLPSVLHPTPLPSLKSVVGLAGGRRSDRDGPNDVAMVVVYAVSKGGSVSAFEIAKSLDVHTTTLPYGTTAAFLQSAIKETLNSIARYSEAQARMARAHETANVALTRTNELVHGLHRMRAVGRQLSSGNEKGPNPLFRCELRPRVAPESMASVISYEYFVRVGVWSKVGIAWGMGWRLMVSMRPVRVDDVAKSLLREVDEAPPGVSYCFSLAGLAGQNFWEQGVPVDLRFLTLPATIEIFLVYDPSVAVDSTGADTENLKAGAHPIRFPILSTRLDVLHFVSPCSEDQQRRALTSTSRPKRITGADRDPAVGYEEGAFWGNREKLTRSFGTILGVVGKDEPAQQPSIVESIWDPEPIVVRFAIKNDVVAPEACEEEDAAYRRCLSVLLGDGIDETDLRRIIVNAERAVFRVPDADGEPVVLAMAKAPSESQARAPFPSALPVELRIRCADPRAALLVEEALLQRLGELMIDEDENGNESTLSSIKPPRHLTQSIHRLESAYRSLVDARAGAVPVMSSLENMGAMFLTGDVAAVAKAAEVTKKETGEVAKQWREWESGRTIGVIEV